MYEHGCAAGSPVEGRGDRDGDGASHLTPYGSVESRKDFTQPQLMMAYILHNAIAALLDCQNTSLLGIPRMLYDERYRDWVIRQVKNPMVRAFWLYEFAGYDKAFRTAAIAPIQNKIGQLLIGPLRNLFGQIGNAIDPRFIMDHGKIFIANLAKRKLGEHEANLVGHFWWGT